MKLPNIKFLCVTPAIFKICEGLTQDGELKVILTKEIYSFGPIKNKLLYDKENRTFY